MADVTIELLRTHFRQLRLPTMGQEFERFAHDAAATNQTFVQFLLGLTEIELETRAANAVATRIKNAEFPVLKDFDTYDFSVLPQLSKPKVLELSRCEWIEHKHNCCLVGSHGTGKTHIAVALGQAACRAGLRVLFFTAAELVSKLEAAQKQYTLDRFLGQLERAALDLRRTGLRQLESGRRRALVPGVLRPLRAHSLLVTSNLPFSEWNQIFQGERMTAALLDRLTHHCQIFEMNGESYRFRESMKSKKSRKAE